MIYRIPCTRFARAFIKQLNKTPSDLIQGYVVTYLSKKSQCAVWRDVSTKYKAKHGLRACSFITKKGQNSSWGAESLLKIASTQWKSFWHKRLIGAQKSSVQRKYKTGFSISFSIPSQVESSKKKRRKPSFMVCLWKLVLPTQFVEEIKYKKVHKTHNLSVLSPLHV